MAYCLREEVGYVAISNDTKGRCNEILSYVNGGDVEEAVVGCRTLEGRHEKCRDVGRGHNDTRKEETRQTSYDN